MNTWRGALWILRDVTWPHVARHRLRALLTLLGVVIGTQVVVSVGLVNRSVVESFSHTVETIAGRADLQIANGSIGVPEELVERVAGIDGVAAASALVQSTVSTSIGEITLFGVDLFGDQQVRESQFPRENVHLPDVVEFSSDPAAVALAAVLLKRSGLRVGDPIEATLPSGRATLFVRGTVDPVGPASLFGGAVGVLDLPTAQRLLGRGTNVDQIDLQLRPGADATVVADALRRAIGGAGEVRPPRDRAAGIGSMLGSLRSALTLASLNSLVVGFFLIYHTLRTAIVHRRRELAVVRAVGYRRSALVLAIALEAVGFGLCGAIVGTAAGVLAGRLTLGALSEAIGGLYGRAEPVAGGVSLLDLGIAVALGVGTALAAAAGPAREALRASILPGLRRFGTPETAAGGEVRWVVGGLLLCSTAALPFVVDLQPGTFFAQALILFSLAVAIASGLTMAIPAVLCAIVRPVARHLEARGGIAATLAAESLLRAPRRARGTVAALMIAFALALIVGAEIRSIRAAILGWIEQTFAADLYVTAAPQLPLPSGPTLAGDLEERIAVVPGVAEVGATRLVHVEVDGRMVVLRTQTRRVLERMHYPVVRSVPDALERFGSGDGVIVSENLAIRSGIGLGDEIRLATPRGERRFPVLAVVVDYTLDIGTVSIEQSLYRGLWGDRLVNNFYVWLAPGAASDTARTAIAAQLGEERPVTVLTAREFEHGVAAALEDALRLGYASVLVAVLVATIGIVNFFLAEIVDRRREIGLLRSVALDRRQLVRTFLCEAGWIGLLGGLLAIVDAWPVSLLMVKPGTRMIAGWNPPFDFPWGAAVAVASLCLATSVLAAWAPVRRAGRGPVAPMITFE